MKLLPKSEIDKRKAEEQRQSIDEGVKLAARVDGLRNVHAEEEVSLETFRRETVLRIHQEIDELVKKRNELIQDFSDEKARRLEALKLLYALYADDVTYLEHLTKELKATSDALKEKEAALKGREETLKQDEASNKRTLASVEERERQSRKDLIITTTAREEAELSLTVAHKREVALTEWARNLEANLVHRENEVVHREESATMQEQGLNAEKQKLSESWALLRDREALLDRTIKRTKNLV